MESILHSRQHAVRAVYFWEFRCLFETAFAVISFYEWKLAQNITEEAVSSDGYIGSIFVHIIYRAIYLGLR